MGVVVVHRIAQEMRREMHRPHTTHARRMPTYYGRRLKDRRKGNNGFQGKMGRFGRPFPMPDLWFRGNAGFALSKLGTKWQKLPIR